MKKKANLVEANVPLQTDWISQCGVCEENFLIRDDAEPGNPYPHGSFCPDCKESGLIAPGVLHWKRRNDK